MGNFIFKNKEKELVSVNFITYEEYRKRTNHGAYWLNYTPHPINVVITEIKPKTHNDVWKVLCAQFPPSEIVTRIEFGEPTIENIDGFTIHDNVPIVGIINLPNYVPNINILVSGFVREQMRGTNRFDIFSPDTGVTALRNEKGKVIAVRALQRA